MEYIRDRVRSFFPEMNDVINKDWVRQACSVWEEVLKRSKWETMEQAPFGVSTPGITLIGHTKAVLRNALGIAQNLREIHQANSEINFDVLIVACILHDVDKLLAIEPAESGGCRYSEIARTYQHGFYSAYYAELAGLPSSIVTLLINHTAQSRMPPATIEGMILFYADIGDADLCKFIHGQSSSLLKAVGKTTGGA